MNDDMKKVDPKQHYPIEDESKNIDPLPITENDNYKPAEKLKGKVALITGADSGIGQAVALIFAKEGARVAFVDYAGKEDASYTKRRIEELGSEALFFKGDAGDEDFAYKIVEEVGRKWGKIDILVNNAAEHHPVNALADITAETIDRTFRTNIFGFFYFTKAAMPYFSTGATIINTSSGTAYDGSPDDLAYGASNGAIVSFTRSLAQNKEILEKKIRVNSISPGPIWTPFIQSVKPDMTKEAFGKDTPMGRTGEAYELAPAYVFLACEDSSYVTGQVLHINGGSVVET